MTSEFYGMWVIYQILGCGHPFTMLGVSLFITCKNKIQCVCVSCEKKNFQDVIINRHLQKLVKKNLNSTFQAISMKDDSSVN